MSMATGAGRWIVPLLAVVALIGASGSASASASRIKPHSPGIPANARAALLAAAIASATRQGDRRPHDIEAVRTSHRKAERILCGECESKLLPQSAPVYVIAMRGHFNCDICAPPPGHTIGPASVITLEFAVANMQSLESSYGGSYPNLKAVGTPVLLRR